MNKLIYSSLGAAMLASAAFGQISYTTVPGPGCVPFVNGSGNYVGKCYLSGLQNMAPNTCYKVKQARVIDGSVPQNGHMNNNAADTWWWETTQCTTVPVQEPVAGTYTLDPKCVQFHNGSGHYAQNCYNSGLANMESGKCYSVNPARIADGSLPQNGHMNNNAQDAWWWVEAECYNLVPVYPPASCNTNPSGQECQDFCTGLPVNEFCQNNTCTVFPGSCGGPQPVCSNPADQSCFMACEADPTVSSNCSEALCLGDVTKAAECQAVCLVDRHGTACEAYCALNPTEPVCVGTTPPVTNGTQEDCLFDPNGQNCQAFCNANPDDGACNANYCVNNPNDPNCFDKCLNFVNGSGSYTQNCYKSGLYNMQWNKCYAVNPARINDGTAYTQYINNNAADGWWWVQTTCAKEYIIPRVNWTLAESQCVAFVNGSGNYANKCFNSGLQNMPANNVAQNKCYKVNPARIDDNSVPKYGYMNNNAADAWWWVETLCADTLPARPTPPHEGKVAPKAVQAAPALGESEISVDNTTLSVTSTVADTKMLRVFDMNGKLLHSESFSGLAKDVDFAKFAGKGILLVRITSGNKLVAMKKVSIR
ncbi:hypothetical protein [uncultured Fibrobacter sp.]|uniref:hypothetical protein n=1 Tax=uncultured Fibrobacter sp. TaxID=261512 RepID=UPI0025EECE02|nr:hypothetical protein [uncultured Fibrobacter sp.]